ncbi:glycoside hydrolase family 2 TIM barrel-domain containing protein [Prevotella sp. AGR2160]|uniref:glycoside hydrolase family 2 TIM barrel-domain containing protein n=1 Tax=Prevotella sp. AGR2160 TaxID=1280674 RepID=UPI0003FD97F1
MSFNHKLLFTIASALCLPLGMAEAAQAQVRQEITLQDGWQFSRDSIHWQTVSVPHDWAIAGPFDKKWDLQYVAITQNGETEKSEKSGRSGALPWIGKGYYVRSFSVPSRYQHAVLHFDGAMSEPTVYVNGHRAAYWAYGYNAFRVDVTPYIHHDGRPNTLSVSLSNEEESSRWYPGGGIYRPVTLILTGKTRLDRWKTFYQATSVQGDEALLRLQTAIDGKGKGLALALTLLDANGHSVATKRIDISDGMADFSFSVKNPKLWSPETPYLYSARLQLYQGKKLIDERQDKIGIRTISFSKEHGFMLNGKSRKFQGVCLHHDLGPLGAAVNKAALIRQVEILKDMGCDAIRTSHNMPSTMQMEVYDSLGMMVMAESFDMWKYPKCKNGYARFFDRWADKDITNLVLNHRNHPSLVMYSIGNEIPEQWSEEGRQIAEHLQDLCHQLDPTRPVTQGMDRAEDALKSGFAQTMDIPGFNYRVQKYDTNIQQLPKGFLLGSETASTVSSRGVYKFPVTISDHNTYPDGQCSSYDTEYCSWSNLPDADFLMQDDRTYTIGQFVWTGFDYLGEPTPYDNYWPSRSSYFGICDLAGLPKDRYYLYRSVWNKHSHTLHVLPHWTWPGREGQVTPIFVYTDYPSAELFINGKSQGRHSKKAYTVAAADANTEKPLLETKGLLERYRLMWDSVRYEPGVVKVVAYDEKGNIADSTVVKTAGPAAKLMLQSDRTSLHRDKNDLAYITVSLTDKDGTLCPDADDEITVNVTGNGGFEAICNGDATSLESFKSPHMKLFHGQLVITVHAGTATGPVTVTVKGHGLQNSISIPVE